MPYPPNLSRMPAKIIDPATGASTWALGSHRCREYIGILARNAVIIISHQRRGCKLLGSVMQGEANDAIPICLAISRDPTRRGSLAVTVYSIRYAPACIRSG